MNPSEKQVILEKAKEWFEDVVAERHVANTQKLSNPEEFNINPFLTTYLANYLTGNSSPQSIARALILPRVLGTSITTSFGQNIQRFSTEVLASYGSAISGIDLEFLDQVDGEKKYCQLKAGPNTINKDDVESIHGHFSAALRLARANNLRIANTDLVVGVLYGTHDELSGHYLRLETQYHHSVFAGSDFWVRLTGDEYFYRDLIRAFCEVASTVDGVHLISRTIDELANTPQIRQLAGNAMD